MPPVVAPTPTKKSKTKLFQVEETVACGLQELHLPGGAAWPRALPPAAGLGVQTQTPAGQGAGPGCRGAGERWPLGLGPRCASVPLAQGPWLLLWEGRAPQGASRVGARRVGSPEVSNRGPGPPRDLCGKGTVAGGSELPGGSRGSGPGLTRAPWAPHAPAR